MVTPVSMLFAPAQVIWPPLRTANMHAPSASVLTAEETSCAERGCTMHVGSSCVLTAQYEWTDFSYAGPALMTCLPRVLDKEEHCN